MASQKKWYESLFENYAKSYDQERFTQGTPAECNFIENEIEGKKAIPIIDIGSSPSKSTSREFNN